jgi:release factor glutamine methyltransferase
MIQISGKRMTVREILQFGELKLKSNGIEEYKQDARILLYDLLGIDQTRFLLIRDKNIKKIMSILYKNRLRKRIADNPVQHITGVQEFMSLKFIVNKNVLIPRQDTETLVEYIINDIKESDRKSPFILEIGTGSGCISISIAKNTENISIIATDISSKALKTAKKNYRKNEIPDRIDFLKSDLFTKVKRKDFDYIISNPPYIDVTSKNKIEKKVLKEPELALFSNNAGLYHIERIIKEGKKHLKINGMLALEIGYNQRNEVVEIFKKYGYNDIKIIKDYNNHDRVISAIYRERI